MARLVLGTVGAAVGGLFGQPQIGWMIGSALGGFLEPPIQQEGPRLNDLKVQYSTWGTMIPEIHGAFRVAGNVIWSTDLIETQTVEEHGGKGGPTVETTTYSYSVSCAISMGKGPIAGIRKIWANGQLIYNAGTGASVETALASSGVASAIKVYLGTEDQMPDPTIEADKGAGNVPAYRGQAYIVFEGFQLADYGNRVPNFEFEEVADGISGVGKSHYAEQTAETSVAWVSQDVCYWWSRVWPNATVYRCFPGVAAQPSRMISMASALFAGAPVPCKTRRTPMFAHAAYGFNGLPNYVDYYNLETGAWVKRLQLPLPGDSTNGISASDGMIASYDEETDVYGYAICRKAGKRYGLNIGLMKNGIETLIEVPAGRLWLDFMLYRGQVYALSSSGPEASHTFYLGVYDQDSGALQYEWQGPTDAVTATSQTFATLCVNENGAFLWYLGATRKIWRLTDSGATLLCSDANTSVSNSGSSGIQRTMFWTDGTQAIVPPTEGPTSGKYYLDLVRFTTVQATPITVGQVVSRICGRAGVTSIDVSELTSTVSGYAVTRQASARANIAPLQKAFYFDAVESDGIIKFKKRGGAVAATIPYEELAAHEPGSEPPDPLNIRRMQEVELPQRVTINYANLNGDYQQGSESSQRLVTASKNQALESLAIAMTPDKAAQIADVLMYDAHVARTPFEFATTKKYAKYEPCDVLAVESQGASYRVRLVKKDESGPLIRWQAVADDASVYTSSAVGATQQAAQEQINLPGPTNFAYLDIPILRDEDDNAGFYAVMGGYKDGWRGATLFRAPDDVTYIGVGTVLNNGTIGECGTTLGNWIGGNFFDEANTLDVTLTSGELASKTNDEVLAGANAALVGSEIIQFKTATLIGAKQYRLSGLLRGRRGTEQHMGSHAARERFILLTVAGTLRPNEGVSAIGVARNYKAASIGSRLVNTAPSSFRNNAVGLKPLSPVHFSGGKQANGDFVIGWTRRTRVGGEWRSYVDAQLGEASESYEVDIMSGSTVKRTLTSSTPTVTYTAAMQTADFGGAQSNITVKVYQMSATVGRGFPGTHTY